MTHGTLTNKQTGQTLTGEALPKDETYLNFRIDGCMEFNVFWTDEWDFTPGPEQLPEVDGYYVSDAPDYGGSVYQRSAGYWTHLFGAVSRTEAEMRDRLPLVRLVREDGKPL